MGPFEKKLSRLIEASVEELVDQGSWGELFPDLEFYRRSVLAFHKGETAELERIIATLESDSPPPRSNPRDILPLIWLRYQILTTRTDPKFLAAVGENADKLGSWAGETMILLATAYGTLGDHAAARKWFEKAVAPLNSIGAHKKALLAELNSLVALSHLEPHRKLLTEYFYLYRKANKSKHPMVAATSLLNLSREYQKMGAHRIALKFVNRALGVCKSLMGSLIFYQCTIHRAHVLYDLGRDIEASLDVEMCKSSEFPVIRQACDVLAKIRRDGQGASDFLKVEADQIRMATWRERLEEYRAIGKFNRQPLGASEESLVLFLAEKPREKFEICEHLFGKELDPFAAENRLKNVILRVRKKLPGLIVCADGKYSLADRDQEGVAPVRAMRKKAG